MRRAKRLALEELAPVIVEPRSSEQLDWREVFGNDHPVEIEVGFGKGRFIVSEAGTRPDTNFFGVEIERKYHLYVAGRLVRRGLRNARVACTDAKILLRDSVPPASVQAVHVYFPDPWWKRRHWKRRLYTPEFVETCARILKIGGHLSIATDVGEYFEIMMDLTRVLPSFRQIDVPEIRASHSADECLGNFEWKAHLSGRTVHQALFQRVEGDQLEFRRPASGAPRPGVT